MELTIREKEVLNIFGCMNYEATMKRLGLACTLMVDPLTKTSAYTLRKKLSDIPCDIWYVKEKDPDRKDDKELAKKLKAEHEGIALWALEGLKKLVADDFHFTVSERTKEALEENKKADDNLLEFIESEGYLHFQEDVEITTKDFYDIYLEWCEDNLEKPRVMSSFSKFFKENGDRYGLEEKKNVKNSTGKRVRGFKGVCKWLGPNPFEEAA